MARSKKKTLLLSLCFYLFFFFQEVGYADNHLKNNNNPEIGAGLDNFNLFATMVKVVVVLAIMVGLIILLIYFLSHKNKSWMSSRSIRILGGIQLGQNKSLQVIEVGHSIYLVGVGDNVQLIEKIDDKEEVSYITESLTDNNSLAGKQIGSFITKWIHRLQHPRMKEEQEIPASFQEVFQSKMKSISNREKMVQELMRDETTIDRSNEP